MISSMRLVLFQLALEAKEEPAMTPVKRKCSASKETPDPFRDCAKRLASFKWPRKEKRKI